MRAIWKGAVTFGLVNVPVKVVTAVRHKEIRFHMLHDKDGGRINQKRVCSVDGEEVPYEEIAKGYEIKPDEYVMIEPEELKQAETRRARTANETSEDRNWLRISERSWTAPRAARSSAATGTRATGLRERRAERVTISRRGTGSTLTATPSWRTYASARSVCSGGPDG